MAITARLDLSVWRNDETYEYKLLVRGQDLSSAALRAQVRLAPDTPGAALVDLFQVQDGSAQGIQFAGVSTDEGIPVSDVRIRISKATRAALPYAGELGDSARLAWVFTIDGVTRLVGDFIVLAHTLASDSAPVGRSAGGVVAAAAYPSASATLTISQDQGATVVIDGVDEITPLIADARALVDQAAEEVRNPRSETLADVNRNRVAIVAGGVFQGGASATSGAIKIDLPQAIPDARNTMFTVTVMDQYGLLIFDISGVNNANSWDYAQAAVRGSHQLITQPAVRFGHDGNSFCVWIGELAYASWAYPQVIVSDVKFAGNVITEAWLGAWSVGLVSAFDTVTNGPITARASMSATNPTFAGTLNGMQFRAPTLQGGTYVGFEAGLSVSANSTYNHFYGYQVGKTVTTGFNNCGFGLQVLSEATTAQANSGFGTQALQHVTTAQQACAFGIHALLSLTTGVGNVAVGAGAMEYLTVAEQSTALGTYAGRDNQKSRCIFIGQRAGLFGAAADDELWIGSIPDGQGNADSDALIRGNMADRAVRINGKFGCNGALPVAPTALPAALPTNGSASNAAMASMLNAIRTALIATGISTSA